MQSFFHRLIVAIFALGCIVPVFALTSVTLTDGSVSRGTIVSEGPEFIVLNVDGADMTIPRSTIQAISNDENPSMAAPVPAAQPTESPSEPAPLMDAPAGNTSPASGTSRLGRETRERVSIGIDVYLNSFSRSNFQNEYKSSGNRTTSSLALRPYVGIRRSDILELRPALLFVRSSVRTDSTVEEGLDFSPPGTMLESSDSSLTRLGFDFGFIFYPIHGNFFRLSIGPSLGFDWGFSPKSERTFVDSERNTELEYDSYIDMNIPIRIPVGFDFVVSEHLGFRLSGEVYGININIKHIEMDEPSPVDYTTVTTSTMLDLSKTLLDFGLGVFLLF